MEERGRFKNSLVAEAELLKFLIETRPSLIVILVLKVAVSIMGAQIWQWFNKTVPFASAN